MSVGALPRVNVPTVAIVGRRERFPVRRIYCVGRNYAAHGREMGGDPAREPPFFFTKAADSVSDDGAVVPYPPRTANLHHELELVVALGAGGAGVAVRNAVALVWGYAVGVDLTRRDLQDEAKAMRRPWDTAKSFDAAAPCGALRPADGRHPLAGEMSLAVNGQVRQQADLCDMIWPVADLLAELSTYCTLCPGDLVYTGTPAGVGPLVPGDRVAAAIADVGTLGFTIGPPGAVTA